MKITKKVYEKWSTELSRDWHRELPDKENVQKYIFLKIKTKKRRM